MAYQIEFHPVGSGANSGDAITMRYWTGSEWRVIVIDAGFQDTGDAIVEHIRSVYGIDTVEHVVSTHPDNDHISEVVVNALMRRGLAPRHLPSGRCSGQDTKRGILLSADRP